MPDPLVSASTPSVVLQLTGFANQGPPGPTGPQGPPGSGGGGGGGSSVGADSITGSTILTLVNDSATPGNNMYYGTDGSGVQHWLGVSSLGISWSQITSGIPSTFTPSGNLNTQYSLTGGASLSSGPTINLVGDVASPGNSMLYGTNGSGVRGWYAQPSGSGGSTGADSLTGTTTMTLVNDVVSPGNNKYYGTDGSGVRNWLTSPTVPTVGTLTTSDSITGGGAMTGNLTILLVGDTLTPGNSQFYGTNGSGTRGWYAQPVVTQTISRFKVGDGNSPATNYSYFGTRDSGVLGVWQFAHGGVDTTIDFCDIVPQGITFTTGIKVVIFWASTTATSGAVEWQASIDNANAHSIDTDSFGTAVSVITTTSGSAANMNSTTISLPNANLQSLAAEQPFKLKLTRRASDTSNDTMADVASLWQVMLKTY